MNEKTPENDFHKLNYQRTKWSDEEAANKMYRTHLESIFSKYSLPFSQALILSLRKSVFGSFLNVLNPNQDDEMVKENKLAILNYELRQMNERQWQRWKLKNQVFDNMYGCLSFMIKEGVSVCVDNLKPFLNGVRICEFYTNGVDKGLRSFKNLQVLVLSGNNLRDVDGSFLPRNLKFLDLSNNFLTNMKNLTKKAPKNLTHIGLARNCLTDDCSLHLLTENKRFSKLTSLDLSHNDICNLKDTLATVSSLQFLRSLILEGNPCYLNPFYINQVCETLKYLTYLDHTQILDEDREKKPYLEENFKPELIFQCYRVIGLPKPPTQKNAKFEQTIHIEVFIPLLEKPILPQKKTVLPRTATTSRASVSSHTSSVSRFKVHKSKSKNASKLSLVRSPSISHRTKHGGTRTSQSQNIYERTNEYDEKVEAKNFSFKSARKPWSSIIEFQEVYIKIPENDIFLLRDSLRSAARVDIVYLLFAPTSAFVKEKRDSTKGVRLNVKESTQEVEVESVTKTEEILSKITVASFYCHLEPWNWSNETLDFYWTDDATVGYNGIKVEGSLKGLNYDKGKKPDADNPLQAMPKLLSCHVGFSMTRDLFAVSPPIQISEPQNLNKSRQRSIHTVRSSSIRSAKLR